MKRLEYVGLKKDGERAFKEHTGIEWHPGAQHDVADHIAEQMLKHSDVWREASGKPAALAQAPQDSAPAGTDSTELPAWAVKGIELGATDDQLEAIAQVGGPETEQGAALWKDATGTDWQPESNPATGKAAKKTPAAKKPGRKPGRKAK